MKNNSSLTLKPKKRSLINLGETQQGPCLQWSLLSYPKSNLSREDKTGYNTGGERSKQTLLQGYDLLMETNMVKTEVLLIVL